ncbi:LysR family transcriptional regulator [Lactobacillus sp. PFC-70]|nr:LysR family transcriptional regulator [Lactobacillus sp. PFC-70]
MSQYLNIDYLHTFVIAAKTGKLTTTSEIVYLSHSAVSTQIKKLEQRVGAQLFIRNKDALTLTKQGQTLMTYANQILDLNNNAVKKLRADDWAGKLAIGVPTDYAPFYAQYLHPLLQKHLPDFEFSTVCSRSRQLRQQLDTGEVNFSIAAMEAQYHDDVFLWEEPLHWVCAQDFTPDPQSPLPVALFADNCVMNDFALYSLRKSKKNFQVTFTSTMMDNLATCVQAGIAVALLPESLITPAFKLVPEDYLTCPFTLKVGCTWNHDKQIDQGLLAKLITSTQQAVHQANLNREVQPSH